MSVTQRVAEKSFPSAARRVPGESASRAIVASWDSPSKGLASGVVSGFCFVVSVMDKSFLAGRGGPQGRARVPVVREEVAALAAGGRRNHLPPSTSRIPCRVCRSSPRHKAASHSITLNDSSRSIAASNSGLFLFLAAGIPANILRPLCERIKRATLMRGAASRIRGRQGGAGLCPKVSAERSFWTSNGKAPSLLRGMRAQAATYR